MLLRLIRCQASIRAPKELPEAPHSVYATQVVVDLEEGRVRCWGRSRFINPAWEGHSAWEASSSHRITQARSAMTRSPLPSLHRSSIPIILSPTSTILHNCVVHLCPRSLPVRVKEALACWLAACSGRCLCLQSASRRKPPLQLAHGFLLLATPSLPFISYSLPADRRQTPVVDDAL